MQLTLSIAEEWMQSERDITTISYQNVFGKLPQICSYKQSRSKTTQRSR